MKLKELLTIPFAIAIVATGISAGIATPGPFNDCPQVNGGHCYANYASGVNAGQSSVSTSGIAADLEVDCLNVEDPYNHPADSFPVPPPSLSNH